MKKPLLKYARRCRQINLPQSIKHLICTAAKKEEPLLA